MGGVLVLIPARWIGQDVFADGGQSGVVSDDSFVPALPPEPCRGVIHHALVHGPQIRRAIISSPDKTRCGRLVCPNDLSQHKMVICQAVFRIGRNELRPYQDNANGYGWA